MSRCRNHSGHPQTPGKEKGPWNTEALEREEQDIGAIKGEIAINKTGPSLRSRDGGKRVIRK